MNQSTERYNSCQVERRSNNLRYNIESEEKKTRDNRGHTQREYCSYSSINTKSRNPFRSVRAASLRHRISLGTIDNCSSLSEVFSGKSIADQTDHRSSAKYSRFLSFSNSILSRSVNMAITVVSDSNPQDPEMASLLRTSASVAKKQLLQSSQYQYQQRQKHYESSSDSWKKNTSTVQRLTLYFQRRMSASNISKLAIAAMLSVLVIHRIAATLMARRRWINAPITYMHRQCPTPQYERMSLEQASRQRICITSLTDAKSPSKFQRFIRWRNFDGLLDLTWPNKAAYAAKHGYRLFDQSHVIDTTRPPAWSKILAVKDLLQPQYECDWVMWTDADTLVMNDDIKVTDFLPADDKYDMVVASDKGWGYNSGVFLFRNTPWSLQFLDQWWNMKDFVRPPGFSLSGDNAALKDFLTKMPSFDEHVVVPPRCTINSFAKFLTLGESLYVMDKLEQQEWYMDNEHYHKGDFIAHTPGVDNKAEAIKLLLDEVNNHNTKALL